VTDNINMFKNYSEEGTGWLLRGINRDRIKSERENERSLQEFI